MNWHRRIVLYCNPNVTMYAHSIFREIRSIQWKVRYKQLEPSVCQCFCCAFNSLLGNAPMHKISSRSVQPFQCRLKPVFNGHFMNCHWRIVLYFNPNVTIYGHSIFLWNSVCSAKNTLKTVRTVILSMFL